MILTWKRTTESQQTASDSQRQVTWSAAHPWPVLEERTVQISCMNDSGTSSPNPVAQFWRHSLVLTGALQTYADTEFQYGI